MVPTGAAVVPTGARSGGGANRSGGGANRSGSASTGAAMVPTHANRSGGVALIDIEWRRCVNRWSGGVNHTIRNAARECHVCLSKNRKHQHTSR